MARTSDTLYSDLNFYLFFTLLKAAADGRYATIEEFGFDLAMVNELAELKAKDLVLMARAPGYLIDRHTKQADNASLAKMLAHAVSTAQSRDAIDDLIRRCAPASMIHALSGLGHDDHAWKRRALNMPERPAGRPNNVDDATRERIEAALAETVDLKPLALRLVEVCRQAEVDAEQLWAALRQIRDLCSSDKMDKAIAGLLSAPGE